MIHRKRIMSKHKVVNRQLMLRQTDGQTIVTYLRGYILALAKHLEGFVHAYHIAEFIV